MQILTHLWNVNTLQYIILKISHSLTSSIPSIIGKEAHGDGDKFLKILIGRKLDFHREYILWVVFLEVTGSLI